MKLFVASSWLNRKKAHKLMQFLESKGYHITYDWSQQSQLSPGAAVRDMEGVLAADKLVVLWPGRFGTSTEIGIALGAYNEIFVVGKVNRKKSVYFFHPLVKFAADKEELLTMLTRSARLLKRTKKHGSK